MGVLHESPGKYQPQRNADKGVVVLTDVPTGRVCWRPFDEMFSSIASLIDSDDQGYHCNHYRHRRKLTSATIQAHLKSIWQLCRGAQQPPVQHN